MQRDPAEQFWQWCLRAYARPGVARAALHLQDRGGASVLLLLWVCWRAEHGLRCGLPELRTLHARATLMERHLLVPMRAARRTLAAAGRTHGAAVLAAAARRVLAEELTVERLQAARLAAAATPPAARALPVPPDEPLRDYLVLLGAGTARLQAVAGVLARRLNGSSIA